MTTLKELFPVIEIEGNDTPISFFFLVYNDEKSEKGNLRLCFVSNKQPKAVVQTEEQVYIELKNLFKELTLTKPAWRKTEPYSLQRANNRIASTSLRGAGNTVFGDYTFYHGKGEHDKIANIIKTDTGYFLFVNPKADNYIEKFE